MVAPTAHYFPRFSENLGRKLVNEATDPLWAMLLASYSFSYSHSTMDDVLSAAVESTGVGYTEGGQRLSGVSLSTVGNVTTLTANGPSWAPNAPSAAYIVFYFMPPGATVPVQQYPVCYWDLGGLVALQNVNVSATGLVTFTA